LNHLVISEFLVESIKKQASLNKNEIYGWLIGYKKKEIPNILMIFECSHFEQQSFISAIPKTTEFMKLSSTLPQGIGPIGIYHSHPFSKEIFHSHTDDLTLLSLSNQFPNCISIVTNGQDIKFYKMDDQHNIKQIEAKLKIPQIPRFLNIRVKEEIIFQVLKRMITTRERRKKLNSIILTAIRNFFENTWENIDFYHNQEKIAPHNPVKGYLINEPRKNIVELRVSEKYKLNGKIPLEISNFNEKANSFINKNDYILLSLKLKLKIPIYIIEETKQFVDINPLIKTELLSNIILPKIYYSKLDFDYKTIIIPKDYYLWFLGFYIKLSFFDELELNQGPIYRDQIEFLLSIFNLFELMYILDVLPQFKKQISKFLKELDKIKVFLIKSNKINKLLIKYKQEFEL
jgi:proteasome lid subunit RPN8/RPN11